MWCRGRHRGSHATLMRGVVTRATTKRDVRTLRGDGGIRHAGEGEEGWVTEGTRGSGGEKTAGARGDEGREAVAVVRR